MSLVALDNDLEKFLRLGGVVDEIRPSFERGEKYAVDYQYILMNRWAIDRLRELNGEVGWPVHDFASKFEFAAYLGSFVPVVHYDIRQPDAEVSSVVFKRGDLTALPVEDESIRYATCLHVAEHIGLGRYGDTLDPNGFEKACSELSRVLSPGGNLLFAVPVGRPRVVFNAHRVLSVGQVLTAFQGLKLREFSSVSSDGDLVRNAPLSHLENDRYGCGLFHFTKSED